MADENTGYTPITNSKTGLTETIALQLIRGLPSTSLYDGIFTDYGYMENGTTIEQVLIKNAVPYDFNGDDYSRAALDPTLAVQYSDTWSPKTSKTTTRATEWRKVIAAGRGASAEGAMAEVVATLEKGNTAYRDQQIYAKILSGISSAVALSSTTGNSVYANPKSAAGVLAAIRAAYEYLMGRNADASPSGTFTYNLPAEDIITIIPDTLVNLINVVELKAVFGPEYEALLGNIKVLNTAGQSTRPTSVLVCDKKYFFKASRLFEYGEEKIQGGLYYNHYLHTDELIDIFALVKAVKIDCSYAITAMQNELFGGSYKITAVLDHATATNDATTIAHNAAYANTISAAEGYDLSSVLVTMGGTVVETTISNDSVAISIPAVTGDIVIHAVTVAE